MRGGHGGGFVRSFAFTYDDSLMDNTDCTEENTDDTATGGEKKYLNGGGPRSFPRSFSPPPPSMSALVITAKLHPACRDLALPGKARVVMCARSPILVFGMEIAIRTSIQLWIQLLIDVQL